jgi:hypothetical protein
VVPVVATVRLGVVFSVRVGVVFSVRLGVSARHAPVRLAMVLLVRRVVLPLGTSRFGPRRMVP